MGKKPSQKKETRKSGFQRKHEEIFKEKGSAPGPVQKVKKRKKKSIDLREKECILPENIAENAKKVKHKMEKTGEEKTGEKKLADLESAADGSTLPAEATAKKAGKKPRFILFVGNLSYTSTKEALVKHFKKAGPLEDVRIMSNAQKEPKGCAFVEYKTSAAMLNALLYHHTTFEERKINVEMTVGGGGNSATRKKKIQEKRSKTNDLIHKMLVQKKKSKAAIK